METIKLIVGVSDASSLPLVIAGGFFMALGVMLISMIKANFIFKDFIYKTRWAKALVGFICAAIIMRFLQEYQHVDKEGTLLFIAFGLGVGSDLCIRAVMKITELPVFNFLKPKKNGTND